MFKGAAAVLGCVPKWLNGMLGFYSGMNVRENLNAQTRQFRLPFDLNSSPPSQDMAPSEMHPLASSQDVEAESNIQSRKRDAEAIEVIDNEVSIISPKEFAETRKKPRRNNDAARDNQEYNVCDLPERSETRAPCTFQCPICLDTCQEATSTKCGHIFCKECLEKATASEKKCPTCRKRFKGKHTTFRIYLPEAK